MDVVNNFLPSSLLKAIEQQVVNNVRFPWYIHKDISSAPTREVCKDINYLANQIGIQHVLYDEPQGGPISSYYSLFSPINYLLEEKFDVKINKLIRFRLGMNINVGEKGSHYSHTDYDIPHNTCLLYLNDSDGDTIFFNEKVNDTYKELTVQSINTPVKNQAVLFDGLQYHSSSAPFTNKTRLALNINFL
jgi:hypothetical protein